MALRDDSLAKIGKTLMMKEPFYGIFLLALNKRWNNKIKTAGIILRGLNFNIEINEHYWDSISDDARYALLKHELLHIAFFHITEFDHLADKAIKNLAQDLEVNQYIDPAIIPDSWYTLKSFPHLKLEPNKGTNYYYKKLMESMNNNGPDSNIIKEMKENYDKGERQFTNGKGQPQEMSELGQSESGEATNDATRRLVQSQTEGTLKEVEDQVKKSRGTIPGELQSLLNGIGVTEAPKFDWKSYFRRFIGASLKVYTVKTRRKPNLRFEDNPALKVKQRKHILVAIDTSGSVSDSELTEFFQEIRHIHKTGVDVTIVQCDTAISKIYSYKPNEPVKIYGRGGTSFDPVVDYYNENLRKYTCLVYLTDGEAPAPENQPRHKMLWVLSSKSHKTDHLPGYTIKLN